MSVYSSRVVLSTAVSVSGTVVSRLVSSWCFFCLGSCCCPSCCLCFFLDFFFCFFERTISICSSPSIVSTGLAVWVVVSAGCAVRWVVFPDFAEVVSSDSAVRFVVSTDCAEFVAGFKGLARLPLLSFPLQMMAYSCPSKHKTSGVGESISAQRVQPPIFMVEFRNTLGWIFKTDIPSSIAASSKSDLFAATGKFGR